MTTFVRNPLRGRPISRELELALIRRHLEVHGVTRGRAKCVTKTDLDLSATQTRKKLEQLEITPGVFNAARAAIEKFR